MRSTVLAASMAVAMLAYTVGAVDQAGNRSRLSNPATPSIPAISGPPNNAMPIGDLPGWKQIFADDFTINVPLGSFPAAVASTWSAYPDGAKDTSHHGTYFPSKVVSFHDGMMDFFIHTEDGRHLVVAPGPKLPGGGQLYGRYAVRFRADRLPFYKTAWLLWPLSGNWPHDGEIDFPEGHLDEEICGFVHHQGATTFSDQDAYCSHTPYDAWHVAVTEWTPDSVRFLLDGQVVGTSTSRIPHTPMFWVLQTETADPLHGGVPSDATKGHILIDWVAVYQRA